MRISERGKRRRGDCEEVEIWGNWGTTSESERINIRNASVSESARPRSRDDWNVICGTDFWNI
jgi:hypothetical protein